MAAHGGRTLAWVALAAALVAAVTVAGCGGAERYGSGGTATETTPISELLTRPAAFEGQAVKVEGAIVRECPTGCWFEVGQGTKTLYVDLEPSGIAIPQRVGRTVAVEGTVTVENGQAKLLGRAVEIR